MSPLLFPILVASLLRTQPLEIALELLAGLRRVVDEVFALTGRLISDDPANASAAITASPLVHDIDEVDARFALLERATIDTLALDIPRLRALFAAAAIPADPAILVYCGGDVLDNLATRHAAAEASGKNITVLDTLAALATFLEPIVAPNDPSLPDLTDMIGAFRAARRDAAEAEGKSIDEMNLTDLLDDDIDDDIDDEPDYTTSDRLLAAVQALQDEPEAIAVCFAAVLEDMGIEPKTVFEQLGDVDLTDVYAAGDVDATVEAAREAAASIEECT